MTPRGPDLGSPRGEAARGLSALIDERQQLDERLDALDEQQREARERVETLSAELAELERTAASGGQVSDAARTKAEKELTAARIKAAEPWAERRARIQAAARDADKAAASFIGEHLTELMDELHEDAEAAAAAVDAACRELLAAYHSRMVIEQRVIALAARVRAPRPGDVARTKAEAAVREATTLLEAGGETPPRLVVDPRAPRHGDPVEAGQPAA